MRTAETTRQLRIGIIGSGPVGSILAAHLIEAGAEVVLCDIDREKMDCIKKSGIFLKGIFDKHVTVPHVCYDLRELKAFDLDLVVIAVKTYYLEQVLIPLKEIVTENLFVMSAQNGIDNELEIASLFGSDKTLRMVINYAGNMSDSNTVQVTFFNPPNYVAGLTPAGLEIAEELTRLLNRVKLTTQITDSLRVHVWEKAILNAALAPVCAVTRRTMKTVMDSPVGRELVEAIIVESVTVAQAEGINLGDDFIKFAVNYLQGGGYHRPSMSVDLENGLPTEIDYMNGKIVEYGKRYRIPVPINTAITTLVKLSEITNE